MCKIAPVCKYTESRINSGLNICVSRVQINAAIETCQVCSCSIWVSNILLQRNVIFSYVYPKALRSPKQTMWLQLWNTSHHMAYESFISLTRFQTKISLLSGWAMLSSNWQTACVSCFLQTFSGHVLSWRGLCDPADSLPVWVRWGWIPPGGGGGQEVSMWT